MKSESKVSFALAHRKRLATVMDISLRALEEALGIRREIDRLEKRLAAIFGSALPSSAGKGRREMSAATRAKIAAAARAPTPTQKNYQTISNPPNNKRH